MSVSTMHHHEGTIDDRGVALFIGVLVAWLVAGTAVAIMVDHLTHWYWFSQVTLLAWMCCWPVCILPARWDCARRRQEDRDD